MTALTTAAPRLRKLVLLLSSDHDGEIVSAARAIGRTLKDAGADWHALANAINFSEAARYRYSSRGPLRGKAQWQRMVALCRSKEYRLSRKETDFLRNLAWATREPSEKQLRWLADIFERVVLR